MTVTKFNKVLSEIKEVKLQISMSYFFFVTLLCNKLAGVYFLLFSFPTHSLIPLTASLIEIMFSSEKVSEDVDVTYAASTGNEIVDCSFPLLQV